MSLRNSGCKRMGEQGKVFCPPRWFRRSGADRLSWVKAQGWFWNRHSAAMCGITWTSASSTSRKISATSATSTDLRCARSLKFLQPGWKARPSLADTVHLPTPSNAGSLGACNNGCQRAKMAIWQFYFLHQAPVASCLSKLCSSWHFVASGLHRTWVEPRRSPRFIYYVSFSYMLFLSLCRVKIDLILEPLLAKVCKWPASPRSLAQSRQNCLNAGFQERGQLKAVWDVCWGRRASTSVRWLWQRPFRR